MNSKGRTYIRDWAVDTLMSMVGIFKEMNREDVRDVVFLFSTDDLNQYKIRHDLRGLYSVAVAKRDRMISYIAADAKEKVLEKKSTITHRMPRGMKRLSQRTTKEWGASARPARIKR